MKKLSEIGREMWANEGLHGNQQIFLDAQQLAGHPEQEQVFCYTLEERRELVREALILLCKEWIYPADEWENIKGAAMSQIDGLIKEQGI